MSDNQRHWVYTLRPEIAALPLALLILMLALWVFLS